MNNKIVLQKTLLAASIAVLSACGGGSGGTASTTGSSTVGVITGFGSIYMNGVEYETDSASVSVDGKQSVEGSLGVGDVCTLTSTVNADGVTGTATAVSCADELEGYVLDVAGFDAVAGTGTINVMGQTVTITLDTVYEDDAGVATTIGDLAVDDIVEVHGFSDGLGTTLATRIETKSATSDIEVKGLVSSLDEVALTFKIGNGLTVDYSSANVEPTLVDGLYVEVKADSKPTADVNGYTMLATKVELEEDGDKEVHGDEGDEIEMQGMISDIDLTAGTFRFNGQLVEIASLETDDDFDPSSLTGLDGKMIKVEGYINAAGDFVIKEIEQEHGSEDKAKGTFVSSTETTVTINDNGTERTFTISNTTRMIDEQDMGMTPEFYFSAANLSAGDYVEIEFYPDSATGTDIATELVREDAPSA